MHAISSMSLESMISLLKGTVMHAISSMSLESMLSLGKELQCTLFLTNGTYLSMEL